MTKLQMKMRFYECVCDDETRKLCDRLLDLMSQKRITYGCYSVYNLFDDYHYKELSNKKLEKLTKWEVSYCLSKIENKIKEIKDFVLTQENLPFEETQMQLLIANGTIKYM